MNNPTLVLGGGVAGLSVARQLQLAGRKVAVIDQLPSPGGASYGNGGFISPESFMPGSQPGMLRKVPHWLADPLGPLSITPGQALKSLPWFMKWLRAGQPRRMQAIARSMRALHAPALPEWRRMLGADAYGRFVREQGEVVLWNSDPSGFSMDTERRMSEEFGLSFDPLTAGDIQRLFPGISNEVQFGYLKRGNAHTVSPRAINAALAEKILADGGTFHAERVLKLIPENGSWMVLTSTGNHRATDVVVASGVWSNEMLAPLGLKIPVESQRGYHVMVPAGDIEIGIPFIHRGLGIGLTPMLEGLRIAGTVEFSGVDGVPNEKRAVQIHRLAQQLFTGLTGEPTTVWTGQRPSTPDSLPIVGPAPGYRGLWLSVGHGTYGMTGAPPSGRLLAEQITGQATFIDASPYLAGRFQ